MRAQKALQRERSEDAIKRVSNVMIYCGVNDCQCSVNGFIDSLERLQEGDEGHFVNVSMVSMHGEI